MIRLILFLSLSVVVNGGDAKPFKTPDGKITVAMPGVVTESTQKLSAMQTMKTYSAKVKDGLVVLGTLDVPESGSENEEQIRARLDAGRDQGVQSSKGKLIDQKLLKLAGKYTGREVNIELPGGKEALRSHYYLAEGRMVLLMAIGTPEFIKSAPVEKFFGSLSVSK